MHKGHGTTKRLLLYLLLINCCHVIPRTNGIILSSFTRTVDLFEDSIANSRTVLHGVLWLKPTKNSISESKEAEPDDTIELIMTNCSLIIWNHYSPGFFLDYLRRKAFLKNNMGQIRIDFAVTKTTKRSENLFVLSTTCDNCTMAYEWDAQWNERLRYFKQLAGYWGLSNFL